jgi:hypothetical protein
VREEFEHIREGRHGARSPKQAIAIGLSKARRAGVELPPPREGTTSAKTRKSAQRALKTGRKTKGGRARLGVARVPYPRRSNASRDPPRRRARSRGRRNRQRSAEARLLARLPRARLRGPRVPPAPPPRARRLARAAGNAAADVPPIGIHPGRRRARASIWRTARASALSQPRGCGGVWRSDSDPRG